MLGGRAPSFNKEPFYLGGFKDITHYRGGRAGYAKTFNLGCQLTVDGETQKQLRQRELFDEARKSSVKFEYRFSNERGVASARALLISYDRSQLRIENIERGIRVRFYKSGRIHWETDNEKASIPISENLASFDVATLFYFATRSVRFAEKDEITAATSSSIFRMREALDSVTDAYAQPVVSLPPMRTPPRRSYISAMASEASYAEQVVASLGEVARSKPEQWQKLKSSLERFGRHTGLFSEISVRKLGNKEQDPFSIQVRTRGKLMNIADVGYGVSQVLPLFVMLSQSQSPTTYLMQQPEVHLHPTAQAALGDLFADFVSQKNSGRVIAETHSDYLIDRIRLAVRSGTLGREKVAIHFFRKYQHNTFVSEIKLDENGNYDDPPSDFREFFIRERMKLAGF